MDILFTDNPSSLPLFVAAVAVFLAVFYFVHNRQGIPPGPVGLPYLGVWPFLDDKTCHLKLEEYSRRYGDVSSFTSMGRLFINLASIKAAREAHVTKGDCFADRLPDYIVHQDVFPNGVINANGEEWKTQSKFFKQVMRERGVKALTDRSSDSVTNVLESFIKEMKDTEGQPVNIIDMLTNKCTSTLRLSLFGKIGLTDEKMREITEVYEVIIGCMTPTNLLLVGDFARRCVLPFKSNYRVAIKNTEKLKNIFNGIIDEHKATYDEEHMRDVIDEFIRERNTRQKKDDPTAKYFSDENLSGNLIQFVGDGITAVSLFTSIVIASLVKHPLEQEKIYQEMMEVVGSDRLPTIEDKPNLPSLSAFTWEALRMADFFSMYPAQKCTKETSLGGYKIPKGAITFMNLWSAHNNPETYEEPRKFDPSRFLGEDGEKRAETPIPFGVGKRICPGEGFSMVQIFLFLSVIVKNFKLSKEKDADSTLTEQIFAGKLKIQAHPRA